MQQESAENDYRQTLDYLYTRLPMFSRIGAAALKPDLGNTLALCEALGNPQRKFRSVHIAGTNGKGSTSHMLAAIFQQAGYRTGLYTSPHLVDFRERIRIGGIPVSEDFVCRFVDKIRPHIEVIEPSFFEITVAMAFAFFAEDAVDMAIIETGLGGRLDSTNVISPELSIITNISLDHTDLLGSTTTAIAREKGGIIKTGTPVLVGQYDADTLTVFREIAHGRSAPLHLAWQGFGQIVSRSAGTLRSEMRFYRSQGLPDLVFDTDMAGGFQEKNIRTVLAAIRVLSDAGWHLPDDVVAEALHDVKSKTGLRGRWDTLQQAPTIVADVAHNPDGIAVVMQEWSSVKAKHKHILLGFVRDKDVQAALENFPEGCIYHFCAADIPRALPAAELAAIAARLGLEGTVHPSVEAGVIRAQEQLGADDALLITGSFFVVGEAMQALGVRP